MVEVEDGCSVNGFVVGYKEEVVDMKGVELQLNVMIMMVECVELAPLMRSLPNLPSLDLTGSRGKRGR